MNFTENSKNMNFSQNPENMNSTANTAQTMNSAQNLQNSYFFDPHHPRARLARARARFYHRSFIILATLLAVILAALTVFFFILRTPFAWFTLGLTPVPLMFIFWVRHALAVIPPTSTATPTITDLLSADLLARLTPSTTPTELAQLLSTLSGGRFIMLRFQLPLAFFTSLTDYLPASLGPIFATARSLQQQTRSTEVTSAILAVALIQSFPDHQQLLSTRKLELEDLYQGIIWHNHLLHTFARSQHRTKSGGIARDFAFGFTPTLERFAINLSDSRIGYRVEQPPQRAQLIGQIIQDFTTAGRRSVVLVGPYGSGRTTLVYSLAEALIHPTMPLSTSLKYSQVFSLDVSSLISAGGDHAQVEYLMIRILNETYAAKNIILCLDNAHLFFEEGPGSVDLSNLLLPIIEAGQLRLILTMDEQKFLELSSHNTALATSLSKIIIPPATTEESMGILMDQAPYIEASKGAIYTYRALTEACRLADQYIHDVALPGKAKQLLESAASYPVEGFVTDTSVQTAIEQAYGVKVKVADTTEDRTRLLNLENLIHERMIDQAPAVSAVSHALRRAAAGVKDGSRPIGTFLFLGPTGVGKTELAKSLAAIYFGGKDNLIRLDMNEFVSPTDVSRLIRDGATDPLSLTAQVSKQPFSVVLLDELEKAHSSVLTTLLQVLDEGILRDELGHEISFRDTIIIATSNAGAVEISQAVAAGTPLDTLKSQLIDQFIASGTFKPEFLNRFDEICLFQPLSKPDLFKILDLILASVNRTLEPQKISVQLAPAAKDILLDKGYDPQMGARPLRRLVQDTVENIVAAAILSGHATPGSTLTITPDQISIT